MVDTNLWGKLNRIKGDTSNPCNEKRENIRLVPEGFFVPRLQSVDNFTYCEYYTKNKINSLE
ncbi:MAG TPA: hypothetical protein PKW07_08625 [Syntrophorhabdaceae bacterium]|nr:hypothetical protein [Syntrophorhabdaceae bacterium]